MSIADNIGQRIRKERESLKMSRDQLCRDELDLTVRQLMRIEQGQSLPSLDKLEFIAKRLGLSIPELIMDELQPIPASYYEKKNRLIKFPTYGDSSRIEQKLQLIAEVHETYDELLPEEELLTLDIIESVMNFALFEKGPKTEEIFEDVFLQAQNKKKFQLNDLLVFHYYFLEIHRKKYIDEKLLGQLERKLLKQEIASDDVYNILLIVNLMDISTVYMLQDNYKPILQLVNRVLKIADAAQLQTYKPTATAMKAKYYSHYEEDMERAKQCYDEAAAFAKLFNDDVLAQGIKEARESDGL